MAKEERPRLLKVRTAGNRAAIVFVHGFGGRADETWGQLPQILQAEPELADWDIVSLGYTSDLVAGLMGFWKRRVWSRQPPIQSLADGLVTRSRDTEPLRSYADVVLVAHSMGGLVVQRALVDSESLRARTRRVLLFGTPSGGMELAASFHWVNQQVKDMAAGSRFVRALRDEWEKLRPLPFSFVAAKGSEDFFVPPESSQGPFPLLGGLEFPFEERATVAGDHRQMVKPLNPSDEAPQLLVHRIRGEAPEVKVLSAAWIVRGEGEARETVRSLGGHPEELDKRGLVSLALAYDTLGDRAEAMRVLGRVKDDDADGMGTLGGRYKRAWQEARRAADAAQAISWYRKGYETAIANNQPHFAYYNGINLAYLELAADDDPDGARRMAGEVLGWVAKSTRPDPPWRDATEAEALAYLGRYREAIAKYRLAVESDPRPPAWAIASIYRQAQSVAHYLQSSRFGDGIERLFRG